MDRIKRLLLHGSGIDLGKWALYRSPKPLNHSEQRPLLDKLRTTTQLPFVRINGPVVRRREAVVVLVWFIQVRSLERLVLTGGAARFSSIQRAASAAAAESSILMLVSLQAHCGIREFRSGDTVSSHRLPYTLWTGLAAPLSPK